MPEKVINKLWKDGTIPTFKTDQPIKVKEIDEVSNRVAISIWKNSQVLGFIWALEIKKLNDEDLKTLQLAAKAVRNKLCTCRSAKRKSKSVGVFGKC